MTPRVTVVIMAFQRQNYLMDAIRSVLNSPVDRSAYEIILVIDRIDDRLAEQVEALGVVVLRVASVRGGEMWAAGLRVAKGEVVAFLDDDDCFYPGKLGRILEVFQDPNMVWYHHSFQRVDEGRHALFPNGYARRGTRVYPSPVSRKDWGEIRRIGGFYNNTCHVVRRSDLLPRVDEFLDITFGQDFAIPVLTTGPGHVMIDSPNILSEFRTHWSQGSHPFAGGRMPESHVRFLRGIVREFYGLARGAPTEDARAFCRCRAESYEALLWTTRGESFEEPRGAFRRALRAIRGNLEERDIFHVMVLAFLVSLVPFSRRLTEATYTALKRVEMRGFGLDLPG